MNRSDSWQWTASRFQAAIAIAAVCAACSGSSSGGQDGGTPEDAPNTGSSSSGGDAQSLDDSSALPDSTSSSSSSGASLESGAGDAAPDQSSPCDVAETCLGSACCPRVSQTCSPFTLTPTTVFDSATNLTWTRNFVDITDYVSGVGECSTWGGRIPSTGELTAYAQAQTPCNGQVTWGRPESTQCVWSSTAFDGGAGAHECIFFTGASPGTGFDGDSHYLLCVK